MAAVVEEEEEPFLAVVEEEERFLAAVEEGVPALMEAMALQGCVRVSRLVVCQALKV